MSRNLPVVVGLTLARASQLLTEAGAEIRQVQITRPPGAKTEAPEHLRRVVQQRPGVGKEVCLVVARQISLQADGDFIADA